MEVPDLTLVALGTAIEVLASVFGHPNVDTKLVVEAFDVLDKVVCAHVIPVKRDEANSKPQHTALEDETYSGVQSAFELPAPIQDEIASLFQMRPEGAFVVAAAPRAMPFCLRGRKSFIQYETESWAAMLHCECSFGSLKKRAFLTVLGQLAC